MLVPGGAHLHRVLRMIRTMATPGRRFRFNQEQEPPELAMSGKNLRHAEGGGGGRWWTCGLSSHASKSLTADITACPTYWGHGSCRSDPRGPGTMAKGPGVFFTLPLHPRARDVIRFSYLKKNGFYVSCKD